MLGNDRRDVRRWVWAGCLLSVVAAGATRAEDCSNGNFDSTYALIEKVVFENRGCLESACHGSQAMGGLDLRPGRSYENLMADALTVDGWKRVYPGRRDLSLLFINLAAKTSPDQYRAPLRSMPFGDAPAITHDQLEAIRKWIESGAPKEGVVPGTAELLDACLPPPEPIAIAPLPPPLPDQGLQFRMPRIDLPPHYENEGCFVTYYDVTDQVPEKYKTADGKSFRYRRNEARQDPLSHHLIVSRYAGTSTPDDPAWGAFHCVGGDQDKEGESCVPTDLTFCGDGGQCASEFRQSVACIGFGPDDNQLGFASAGFTGIQETAAEFDFPVGVYRELPLSGVIIWNTHHFNISDKPGKVEAWLNFDYAEPEESLYPALQIFDATDIFWGKCKSGGGLFGCGSAANSQHPNCYKDEKGACAVEPFKTYESCSIHTLPRRAHLYEISSHGHHHMKRWRTYMGAFRCQGGPGNGEPCSPLGYDMASQDVCGGSPCVAMEKPRAGDCNYNNTVAVAELATGIEVALGQRPIQNCPDADTDSNYNVSIEDLIKATNAAKDGMPAAVERNAIGSLMYVSHIYNDPVVLRFDDAPLIFASPDPDQRSLTYCGLYDNGFIVPSEVKLRSNPVYPPNPLAPGGPCSQATHCTAGKVGEACQGGIAATRNRSCDTELDKGDGVCDACPVVGGVTTQDEMFLLLGGYWVQ